MNWEILNKTNPNPKGEKKNPPPRFLLPLSPNSLQQDCSKVSLNYFKRTPKNQQANQIGCGSTGFSRAEISHKPPLSSGKGSSWHWSWDSFKVVRTENQGGKKPTQKTQKKQKQNTTLPKQTKNPQLIYNTPPTLAMAWIYCCNGSSNGTSNSW